MDKVILKNTSWLFLAQAVVKVISFFYTIFLAKSLGVDDFGQYIVALSYFSLVSSLADFGVTRFLVREISVNQGRLDGLLSSAIFLRLSILSLFFAVFAIGAYILDPDLTRRNLSMLGVLAVLPQSVSFTIDAAFIALLKVKYSALGFLLLTVFSASVGSILVLSGYGPYGAILGLIIGQMLYVLSLIVISFWQKVRWLGVVDEKLLKQMVLGSLPYGLLGILGLLYFKVDTLILSYLKGSFETGIYGVAYKFLEAIVFIPAALSTALFPILAKLQDTDVTQIKKIYFKTIKIMGALGVIVMLGYILILPMIVQAFLPSYLPSITAISILALSIPFMFIHVPVSQVLLSSQKHLKPIILLSFLPLIFNVVLNFILIPQYGYLAASWITVASDILSFTVLFIYIQKYFFKNA